MIAQSMDLERRDPCRACRQNRVTDRRERQVSLAAAAAFLLCGLTVVLLEGPLPLAVALGGACSLAAALVTLQVQHKLEARRLRTCGGCR